MPDRDNKRVKKEERFSLMRERKREKKRDESLLSHYATKKIGI